MMTGNDKEEMHPEDMRNLMIFIVAAVLIWVTFDHFLLRPKVDALREAQQAQEQGQIAASASPAAPLRPRDEVIAAATRIRLENAQIAGSIPLAGGRLDDISLRNHYKTHDKVETVSLFSPAGSLQPRYVSFGWADPQDKILTPGKADIWHTEGGDAAPLAPGRPLTLYWDNGQGLRFERVYEIDDSFLVTVRQRVINNGAAPVTLYPYALLAQHGLPEDAATSRIVLAGAIGYIKGKLLEIPYKKAGKEKLEEIPAEKGWIGLTDHYWLTGLFPEDGDGNKFRFLYIAPEQAGDALPRYQTDVMTPARTVAPGASTESVIRIFAGPKKLDLLEQYGKKFGWDHIDLSIDFGMYYFMTKPLYRILHWLGDKAGNFGIGIILLTFVVRIFVFPLANTSYRSFAQLRKVAPQMHELRQKHGEDREKLQAELVKLYEKEKVNPMAGCLPILIQIPIFFALFKVLQISVEMRHAPFYGWIHDLSAPDPTSIFNLFGLIPWHPPAPLMIGAWPCLMLVFMIFQKMMNPPPQDKTQKMMMDMMPFFITFILSKYPVGLVIYWTFSNALSVIQQYVIMKSMGVEPHLFKSKEQKEMEREITAGPAVHPGLGVIEHDVEEALFGDAPENKAESKPVSAPKPKKSKKKK